MKTSLQNLARKLELLTAFEEKYQVGNRVLCVQSTEPEDSNPPAISINAEFHRAWLLASFGETGWKTSSKSNGFQHAEKIVDGVRVCFYKAYEVPCVMCPPTDIPPWLMRDEAFSVPYSERNSPVSDHPATDPVLVAAAIMEAKP